MSLLSVDNIKKTYRVGLRRKRVEAVKGVSFTVEEGEVIGLIGPNGAGKTTSMKCITGLVTPDSGSITMTGIDVRKTESRNQLGYLPEGPYFYEHLRIAELLRFYGKLYGTPNEQLDKRIEHLIHLVGLDHARDRTLGKFSKGMRQRAGMAQSLINDPAFLILDEPQTGLDPMGRKDMRDIILQLNRDGKTVLFSSHILGDVEAVCDRVVMMHLGLVIGVGTIDELTADKTEVVDVVIKGELPADLDVKNAEVERRAHLTRIRIPGEDNASKFIERVLASGSELHSVTPHKIGLEDVFLERTEST